MPLGGFDCISLTARYYKYAWSGQGESQIFNESDREESALPRTLPTTVQLGLEGLNDEDTTWYTCHSIFTPNYIEKHLKSSPEIPSKDQVKTIHAELQKLWLANYQGLKLQNEDYTRSQFINAVLKALKWEFIPEAFLPSNGWQTKKRPDYCLFADENVRLQAAEMETSAGVYSRSITVIEAKKVEVRLDRTGLGPEKNQLPSKQIQDYLQRAKDGTRRFFDWAILTNGNEWRLYCERAANDAYFGFRLAVGTDFCPLEDFRVFVALFSPSAFLQEGERCLLDGFRDNAVLRQEELEANLRKRIFSVLEELATGFYFNRQNALQESDLGRIYSVSLIFLYRLLFVLYAESRELLPMRRNHPHPRYRQSYSLGRFIERLKGDTQFSDDAFEELYDDLLKLFHLIDGKNAAQNVAAHVTRYNGGLFDAEKNPEVETWRIGDKTLARVLRQLLFKQPAASSRSAQQNITTDETIDYATLEVRQLGDIYEGLLGGRLKVDGHYLALVSNDGSNHREGIFYTPDWVVQYLVREALQPHMDAIQQSPAVTAALAAKSMERKQDNSFALAVLNLNLIDPAMGSGHFLVRATEWLGEQILYHPTTKIVTPEGQEAAEIAYWRRRVVEACIYGVDTNSLAVELAKLSLWLTCIAADEPLNFLDHHLRCGNSLLFAEPGETKRLPIPRAEDGEKQLVLDTQDLFQNVLQETIAATLQIEGEVTTEMEVVKRKEKQWQEVQKRLRPYKSVLDLWLADMDGLAGTDGDDEDRLDALTYRDLVLFLTAPNQLETTARRRSETLWKKWEPRLSDWRTQLEPFHWRLEFPDVFFGEDGQLSGVEERGFDAVLGNPPYISTHTSSAANWRGLLERRAGYIEDLYVHFTDLGFQLLRRGGTFGFIVSDTFFTLASKARMREMLQEHRLTHLGQCDAFANATVDAAIFIAHKEGPPPNDRLLFIQARYKSLDVPQSLAEMELPALPPVSQIAWTHETANHGVRHAVQGCLRLHDAPVDLYRAALKETFFEPRPAVLRLYERFNAPMQELVNGWWESIEDSKKFAKNLPLLREYHASLKPGDVTLVGLIAEGGQGMRTANNARFLAYLTGTSQAQTINAKRAGWSKDWLAHPRVGPVFRALLAENGGDPSHPLVDGAAWEASVEPLRQRFDPEGDLGFGRMDLYRLVSPSLIAIESDFSYTWARRKAELLALWRSAAEFRPFWTQTTDDEAESGQRAAWYISEELADCDFCLLCVALHHWAANANKKERGKRVKALGLRSSEFYRDPADAPRVAAIYNGFHGARCWVPFRKGDPSGNRWADDEPLFIKWSNDIVVWLFENSGKSFSGAPVIRNAHLYFTGGVTYTLLGNHVPLKAKIQEPCVFDASASRLTPIVPDISAMALLSLFNSDVFSFFVKRFIKNTAAYEISDIRMTPIVVPTPEQGARLNELGERAVAAKKLLFSRAAIPPELSEYCQKLGETLRNTAPIYLRPAAQHLLLEDAQACLEVIERTVNWEAEKLYGVEGYGPFNEF